MKRSLRRVAGGLLSGVGLLASCSGFGADAFTVNFFNAAGGYVEGGVGFAFTPTTNLAVTSVGLLHLGTIDPVLHFWSDTNFIFASYPLITSNASPGGWCGQT